MSLIPPPPEPFPEEGLFSPSVIAGTAGALVSGAAIFSLALAFELGPRWLFALAALSCSLLSAFCTGALMRQLRAREKQSRDLTELRSQLEKSVQSHQASLDLFASGLDIFVLVVDSRLMIVSANLQAQQAFGPAPILGQSLLAATFSAELEELVKEAVITGQKQGAELVFYHPTQRTCAVQTWTVPPDGERIFVTLYDQTSVRKLERVRRDFVANVSHELRTPLTTIRGHAETLLEEPDADLEFREKSLKAILSNSDRLTRITKDLLTLSRVESGALTKSPMDLAEAVREAVSPFIKRAEAKGLKVVLDLPREAPILGSHGLLVQAAGNLIENAVDYTTKGKVSVRLWTEGGKAHLEVSDTGAGIASEHHARIFERFYRADKGRTRDKGGTGLGLSIAKNIAVAHGGSISLKSALHEGSAFTISLPLEEDLPEPVQEAAAR